MLVYKNTASTVHKYSLPKKYYMQGMCLYCAWCTRAWNTPVPRMEYACTTHGIRLYHAWNMPVQRMEYARTMHGIYLIMHGTCKFHA